MSGERSILPLLTLLIVAALVAFGLVFIWSSGLTSEKHENAWIRQLVYLAVGAPLAVIAMRIPYRNLLSVSHLVYAVTIVVLLSLFFIGSKLNDSRRWISFGPITVQPSEFAKLSVIIFMAQHLRYLDSIRTWRGLLTALCLPIPIVFLVAAQPDLGTALSFFPIVVGMIFVAGARWTHLSLLALAGAILSLAFFFSPFMIEYQKERVYAFLESVPELEEELEALKVANDREGIREVSTLLKQAKYGTGYQQYNAMICVGSGGWMGHGLGRGPHHRKRYLPESHCDFIVAVVAEEWGLLGTISLIGLTFLLGVSLMAIAFGCRDPGGRLIAAGVACLFFFQGTVNIGMSIGLLPITGLPLPFVSAGGSSLLSSLLALGLALGVSRRPKGLDLF